MDKFFLKVLNEEPLELMTLEQLKGGDNTCTCNNSSKFVCSCHSGNLECTCNSASKYICNPLTITPAN